MSGERKFFKGQQAFLRREQDFRRVLRDKEEARPGTHVFAWGMLDDVSADLCRYGVSWDGRAYARKFLLDGSVLEVAHFLNGVPVEDPKLARDLSRTFKSLDGRQILRGTKKPQKPSAQPISGQDAAWAATAIMAKARAVKENMALSNKQERNLDNFVDKMRQALGDLVWGGGRFKQVMAPVTAVAFLFAACNSGVSPTIVPATEAAGPTVTEVAPVETETSFPTPIVVTPTQEASPTATESPRVSEEQLATMGDEEKLAVAPESVDGYTKSNVSTVRGNLVIYRDPEGQAERVYDLTTGEGMILKEGGIIEFDLEQTERYTPEEGEKLELLAFETAKEVFEYMVLEDGTLRDGDYLTLSNVTKEEELLYRRIFAAGAKFVAEGSGTRSYTDREETPFNLGIYDMGGDITLLMYRNDERVMKVIAVYDQNAQRLREILSSQEAVFFSGGLVDPEEALIPPLPEQ